MEANVISLHVNEYGTYHPDPSSKVAWTVNDTRGYEDEGPSCDNCGACECLDDAHSFDNEDRGRSTECMGLSFALVCLDGGDALCTKCAEAEGLNVKQCDCD